MKSKFKKKLQNTWGLKNVNLACVASAFILNLGCLFKASSSFSLAQVVHCSVCQGGVHQL